jgi:arylsulfatase A-like enzyme
MTDVASRRPNILFIMSDDHAAHAISAYSGGRINNTPHLDRLAAIGARCDRVFCTNSICAPSRACILSGTYNHVNGVRTLDDRFDGAQDTVSKRLQQSGYETAIIGKWHLGHWGEADPTGFDHWCVLPGQGDYFDPEFFTAAGTEKHTGYVTELITEMSIDWLKGRSGEQPWMLMCHHKAPHRSWEHAPKYATLFDDVDIPTPETFDDNHSGHAQAAQAAKMTMWDLNEQDLKQPVPEGLSREEERHWRYQRYIKDYLRCVQSVDDSVGDLLDYLEASGQLEDTIVIYTSDQGFFLGDHNWYGKRFMYEESLRMPFLISYPREISPGSVNDDMILNVDFPATFMDWAGLEVPQAWQGASARACFQGKAPADWRTDMYYRYWMHKDGIHQAWAHYGLRTEHHKLICYYADALDTVDDHSERIGNDRGPEQPEWELFDLRKDPKEMLSVYDDPDYEGIVAHLKTRLRAQIEAVGDVAYDHPLCALG